MHQSSSQICYESIYKSVVNKREALPVILYKNISSMVYRLKAKMVINITIVNVALFSKINVLLLLLKVF